MKRQRQRRDLLAIPWVIAALFGSGAHGQCEVTQLGDGIGTLSIDGDGVAVLGDSQAFGSLGAVYVYRRGPDGPVDWTLEATLMAPEPDTEDLFGFIARVNSDTIVVGAHHTAAPEFNSGAAYVYRFDGKQWQFQAMLTASDGEAGDIFGWSVAVDDDVILIGARDEQNDGLVESGSAYVFRYDPDTRGWSEEAKLTDPGVEEGDVLGFRVSISGDVALVGAPGNDDAGGGTGAAFVFRYDPKGAGGWPLEQQLQAFDAQWAARFGWSVSLIDNLALIGAPWLDSQIGAAYVMRYDGNRWVHEAKLLASNPVGPFPLLGTAVSLSSDGSTASVGAPLDNEAGNQAGASHLFRTAGGEWKEISKFFASDAAPGDGFGGGSLSDDLALLIGGGKGYIFAGMQGLDCNENGEPDACDIFNGASSDENGNGIHDECESIPGDINGDGVVNSVDLLILLVNWGLCENCDDCPADIDGNCTVGASDLLILLVNWG